MSNTRTFAEKKFQKIKFISIEHGLTSITLSIIESPPHKSMEILLSADEARAIATDLIGRIDEITNEVETL